ncbi:MAG: exodeoxyribonuclease VII large subunit [Planctomycetota bacterium]|jgi:exodeoxyribonuclease VII large subunit
MDGDWDPGSDFGEVPEPRSGALTVTALTRRIKGLLEGEIGEVRVVGEVSNLRIPRSGHAYFTLKDEHAQIRAVLFRRYARGLRFDLADGIEVEATGEVSVYEPRGEYQIVVTRMEPKGLGALQLQFEQRKEKLRKEGLFDPARKRPIPFLPRRMGVITSATGAAVRDICNVSLRRFPRASLLLHPVKVQGEGAAEEIAEAVAALNRIGGIDVLIVGRGGGSLEDLWAFNEEVVARAVAASAIPVISAVGHEVDFTICDFTADVRAATPSEAAELAWPQLDEILLRLDTLSTRLMEGLRRTFEVPRARVEAAQAVLDPHRMLRFIQEKQQRLDEWAERLEGGVRRLTTRWGDRLTALDERLSGLNPKRILARGYSVTLTWPEGKAVRKSKDAPSGTRLKTILAEGEIFSVSEGDAEVDCGNRSRT